MANKYRQAHKQQARDIEALALEVAGSLGSSKLLKPLLLEKLKTPGKVFNARISAGEMDLLENIRIYLADNGIRAKLGYTEPPKDSDALHFAILLTSLLLPTEEV